MLLAPRESMLNRHCCRFLSLRPRGNAIASDLTFEQTLEAFSNHVFSRASLLFLTVRGRILFLRSGVFFLTTGLFAPKKTILEIVGSLSHKAALRHLRQVIRVELGFH